MCATNHWLCVGNTNTPLRHFKQQNQFLILQTDQLIRSLEEKPSCLIPSIHLHIFIAIVALQSKILASLCLSLGLPGGIARSTHSSSSSDIKREEKEDDENSSVADKSEDEKKDSKVARSRTR